MTGKNIEKRRRVMQRSMKLGRCICDPKLPCPCDLLREKDVCLCAGERLEVPAGPVRLTQRVEKTGCASKIDQATLRRVLGGIAMPADPRVIIGAPAGDDAGVFQAGPGQAWVQTVDVFSPCVDDPYLFGQIAAANSVSDIYAMGGTPMTALSIIGFPARELPESIMSEIVRGGVDKMAEAGVAIIGGHSINDREIKAGFAVTGLVDPDRIRSNAAASPGDALVLTKPLGTGILSFAAQIDRLPRVASAGATGSLPASASSSSCAAGGLPASAPSCCATRDLSASESGATGSLSASAASPCCATGGLSASESGATGSLSASAASPCCATGGLSASDPLTAIGRSMATLNKTAAELMCRFDAHACTDITGFGMIGHLSAMAAASGVDIEIVWDDVPLFDGVLECVAAGIVPGAIDRNRESSQDAVVAGDGVTPGMLDVLFDAQTSGGLLIALPADRAGELVLALHEHGIEVAAVVGRVLGPGTGRLHVRTTHRRPAPQPLNDLSNLQSVPSSREESHMSDCCSSHGSSSGEPGRPRPGGPSDPSTGETKRKFQEFLQAVNQPGALDAHTKQAISIALAVLAKCDPCVRAHIAKAKEKGFSPEEIDEAAWMAISFGGAPLMMFYNGIRKEVM